jgi:hypothetical protein
MEYKSDLTKKKTIVKDEMTNSRYEVVETYECDTRHCTMVKLQHTRFKFEMVNIAYPVYHQNLKKGIFTVEHKEGGK